jgi:hypothetical protein
MPLQPPKLDDRDFTSLVAEARTRIPTFTGEWTNFNDSDPGFTLVQLHAWLTETLIWRVNRLPDLAYINMLNLLGTAPAPARAATAELSFRFKDLDKIGDPLTILVPQGVEVGADDADLLEPLSFTTDRTLRGINAAVATILVPGEEAGTRQIVGDYDPDEATLTLFHPFKPFGNAQPTTALPREMLIGLLLRPIRDPKQDYFLDRFPEGELDLSLFSPQVFETNAGGDPIPGPLVEKCRFPWETQASAADVEWSAFTYTETAPNLDDTAQWTPLSLRGDETAGIARSGHLYLDIPARLPMVPFASLSRAFWDTLGLSKPPTTRAELIADLQAGVFVASDLDPDVWRKTLGYTDPPLQDLAALVALIAASPEPNLGAVKAEAWSGLGYSSAPAPFGLVWLKARLTAPRDIAPELSDIRLNTVGATAATTRTAEILGISAGRPNQSFLLKRKPVLIDPVTGAPDFTLVLEQGGTPDKGWQQQTDFFGADRTSAVYLLDPTSGTVTFGDGVNGRIPVAGTRIIATRYRVGGGASGNVAAATITKLKTALPQVDSVTNLRAAAGGSDAETLDAAKLRAPQLLRTRDRAVTPEDFSDLALRTPGVALKAAYALPLTRLDASTTPPTLVPNSPGSVTVVVLPDNREETPQPSEAQLRLICAQLNARRLITTELYVTGPRYQKVASIRAEIIARSDADLKAVQDDCLAALLAYFHPLHGGEDGAGWPFGGDIYRGNVFDLLLGRSGVARVPDLKITLQGVAADECADVLPVADGTLIDLPPSAISLNIRYGRG